MRVSRGGSEEQQDGCGSVERWAEAAVGCKWAHSCLGLQWRRTCDKLWQLLLRGAGAAWDDKGPGLETSAEGLAALKDAWQHSDSPAEHMMAYDGTCRQPLPRTAHSALMGGSCLGPGHPLPALGAGSLETDAVPT